MNNKKFMPYNFDEKVEYKIYKKIGKNIKKNYQSQNGMFFKIIYRLKNSVEDKEYKKFNTYSEWRNYVIRQNQSKLAYSSVYFENYIHFLKGRKRHYKFEYSVVMSIVAPIYLALASGAITIFSPALNDTKTNKVILTGIEWALLGAMLIAILVITYILNSRRRGHYYFYKDYLDIVIKYKKESG